jgi:hypothetical protein
MNIFFYAVIFLFLSFDVARAMETSSDEEDMEVWEPSGGEGIRLVADYGSSQSIFNSLNQTGVKESIANVWRLSLVCDISEAAIEDSDESSDESWNEKYIFTSIKEKDINDILRSANNLIEIKFYNIPSLVKLLTNLPLAASITHFSFDYDTNIFDASIYLEHLGGCHQFVNLQWLSLHTGVFTFAEKNEITGFFTSFPHLQTLVLTEIMRDQDEGHKYSTNILQSLGVLTTLNTLRLSFVDRPDFRLFASFPLLSLQSLDICCHREPWESVNNLTIGRFFETFTRLKSLKLDNIRIR